MVFSYLRITIGISRYTLGLILDLRRNTSPSLKKIGEHLDGELVFGGEPPGSSKVYHNSDRSHYFLFVMFSIAAPIY